MRTIEDLHGALELRARLLDPVPADADSGPTPIAIAAAPSRTRRHQLLALLSAAAIVLVVLALAVRALTASDRPAPAGSSGSPDPLPAGAWPFSLAALPDLVVADYSWFDGQLEQLHLGDDGHALELTVYAPQAAYQDHQFPQLRSAADGSGLPGATRVEVGDDVAYYGAFGDTSHVTPGTVEAAAANQLVWQYAPDAWALLHQQGAVGEDELLRVARAVDFSNPTEVRTPVTFDAPAGTELVDWQLTCRHRADQDPTTPWTVMATYAAAPGNSDVVVEVHDQPIQAYHSGSPVDTSVNGRSAQFYPTDPKLDFAALDFSSASGVYAQISWPSADGVDPTQRQLVDLAATMQAAEDPGDPTTWFDGRTVLP